MIDWALRNPGYAFLLILAAIFLGGLTVEGIVRAITRPFTMRSHARIAEAKARTAEAKARRAALAAELQPPAADVDRPSRQAIPQGVVLGKGQ